MDYEGESRLRKTDVKAKGKLGKTQEQRRDTWRSTINKDKNAPTQAARKRGVVASFPGDSIGARVAAKNAALAAIGEEEAAKDPAVDTAMEDLVSMLEGASIGGRRRLRGGGPTAEAIGSLFSGLKAKADDARSGLDGAVATVVNNLGTVGAASGAVAVLNHPSVIGNMAQLFAEVLKLGTPQVITSTWGQWGTALLQLANAAGTVAGTVVEQTAQGPVVPVAIAVLVTMIRGNKSGRSFAQVLKDDALAFASGAAYAVTSQVQAASDAYRAEAQDKGYRQLKELAGRIERPRGPGVVAMETGVPAVEGTAAGTGFVAASPGTVSMIPAVVRGIPSPSTRLSGLEAAAAAPGRHSSAAAAADAAYTLAGMPYTAPGETDMKGGRRRKTKKRASKKRRATRRQPVFVY